MKEKKAETRVKMCIDISYELSEWIRARSKANLRAMCREVEVVLIEAKRRDEEAANEGR